MAHQGLAAGGVDSVPLGLLKHEVAHRTQIGGVHSVRREGVGHAAVPHRYVVHAAQDIIDLRAQGRDAAQAAPGALDGDEAAVIVVLVGGHPWPRLQGEGGIWRLGKSLALDHTLKN